MPIHARPPLRLLLASLLAATLALLLDACATTPPPAAPAPPPSIAESLADASPPPPSASAATPSPPPALPTRPPPAPTAPDAGPAPALALQQRATACLLDPTCPASEADRLFRAADDAHEDAVDCFRFADGDDTQKDLARARACLARSLSASKCDGSSADLGQAELAMDLIDGVGGPQDITGARKLFDGCFADVTQQEVLEYADARAASATAPHKDFCKDYGGTTLTSNACAARGRQHQETQSALLAKKAVAGLDDEGKRLFAAASAAYASYVGAMGSYVYEVWKDGTIRNMEALAEESALLERRTMEIGRFAHLAATATSADELARSSRNVDDALKKQRARAATDDVRAKIADAQRAWSGYRDAEVALYVHVFGGATRSDEVRDAVRVSLNKARTLDLGK